MVGGANCSPSTRVLRSWLWVRRQTRGLPSVAEVHSPTSTGGGFSGGGLSPGLIIPWPPPPPPAFVSPSGRIWPTQPKLRATRAPAATSFIPDSLINFLRSVRSHAWNHTRARTELEGSARKPHSAPLSRRATNDNAYGCIDSRPSCRVPRTVTV